MQTRYVRGVRCAVNKESVAHAFSVNRKKGDFNTVIQNGPALRVVDLLYTAAAMSSAMQGLSSGKRSFSLITTSSVWKVGPSQMRRS